MAQLEISPPGPRRRHDLCPLDADPEAPSGGRSANLDRRVAGRPPHRGRRAVRRRRGRSQGEAPRGSHGPPAAPPRACGCWSGRCTPQEAGQAAAGTSQRAVAGAAPDRGATRLRSQAGKAGGAGQEATPQEAVERNGGSRRGVSREPWARCSRTLFSCSHSERAEPCDGGAGRPEQRHPALAPAKANLGSESSKPGLPAPPGTRSLCA
jgi:hypothetical protein